MALESDGMVRKRSLKLVEQIVVTAGMWHTTEALASGTIIFEAKDGIYFCIRNLLMSGKSSNLTVRIAEFNEMC